jgi:hypothetical protein
MGMLTEQEIIDCLRTNFRLAAEHCRQLAALPKAGPTYRRLREELKLIEGAARQLAQWREDMRWLQIGLSMEETHQRSLRWLRYHFPRKLFEKLADNLEFGARAADRLRTAATGRTGLIAPKPLEGPLRQGRPVQVMSPHHKSPGGIILY